MQTIVTTRYYGPTDTRGSRIKVSARDRSKFVPFDHAAPGWIGVTEDTLREVIPGLLEGPLTTYRVESVESISGPGGSLGYYLVTAETVWKD